MVFWRPSQNPLLGILLGSSPRASSMVCLLSLELGEDGQLLWFGVAILSLFEEV